MATPAQKAFADALRTLALIIEGGDGLPPEMTLPSTPAPKPVKAKPAPAAEAPKAPAAEAPKPAPAANGAADIITQCRTAAKSYAEVYGREGLKEVLGKYTQGTLADVAPEKLPELLKELS